MPDDIAQLNNKAAMVYQGAMPWHGLGTEITGTEPLPEILRTAKLDWEVELHPMYLKRAAEGGSAYVKVPNRRAVVRDSDQQVLGTVGDAYVALQNYQAFGVLELAREEFGVQIETMGALGRGEQVWALARMRDDVEVVAGDRVSGYFLIVTGHDGATPYTGRLTPIRVVCRNTLNLALAGNRALVRLAHVQAAQAQLDQVAKLVRDMVATLKITGETFALMARHVFSPDQLQEYVDQVLGIEAGTILAGVLARRRGKILELAASGQGVEFAPGSVWTAYNAVTEYVDHVRPAEATEGDQQAAELRRRKANLAALFGAGAALKARALKLAEQAIGAV